MPEQKADAVVIEGMPKHAGTRSGRRAAVWTRGRPRPTYVDESLLFKLVTNNGDCDSSLTMKDSTNSLHSHRAATSTSPQHAQRIIEHDT